MFVLQLNPMTANFERLVGVASAETREALLSYVESEKVEPYSDDDGRNMVGGKLRKSFRKGGPLEFYNPPDRDECIVDIGTADDWAEEGRLRFQTLLRDLKRID